MKQLILDGAKIETRRMLHKKIAKTLDFPEYYGKNLDALLDCLRDICEETHIEIIHTHALKESLGDYALRTISVFQIAAEENTNIHFTAADDFEQQNDIND